MPIFLLCLQCDHSGLFLECECDTMAAAAAAAAGLFSTLFLVQMFIIQ